MEGLVKTIAGDEQDAVRASEAVAKSLHIADPSQAREGTHPAPWRNPLHKLPVLVAPHLENIQIGVSLSQALAYDDF
jgi:hypothetical protein